MLTLLILHGTDVRMEFWYLMASLLTVLLPVSIFTYIAYRLFRMYLKEKREAATRGS